MPKKREKSQGVHGSSVLTVILKSTLNAFGLNLIGQMCPIIKTKLKLNSLVKYLMINKRIKEEMGVKHLQKKTTGLQKITAGERTEFFHHATHHTHNQKKPNCRSWQ